MKIHSRVLALTLAGVMSLSLAACAPKPGVEVSPSPTVSGAPEAVKFLPDSETDLAQKILGVPKSTPLMTVNGNEITAEKYLYFLTTGISSYQQYLAQYGMAEIDWEQESDGSTLKDYMKDEARKTALSYQLFNDIAKERNLAISDEEMQTMVDTRAGVIEQLGGEGAYGSAMERLGISDSTLWWINTTGSLYSLLLENELGAAPEITDPTDEELAASIKEQDLLSAKHILYLTQDQATGEDLDEAAIAAQRAKAEAALKRLGEAEDPIALFDTIMNEESEDSGLPANPTGYVFSKGEMVEPFETGTRALEIGKISGIVESDFGFHIILRQDPATEETRAQLKAANSTKALKERDTKFSEIVDGWIADAEITYDPAFETLDAQKYYEGVLAHQAELDAAEATPSPEVSPEVSPEATPEVSPAA